MKSSAQNHSPRRIYLLYGILVMLFLGLVYVWSVFIAPLEGTFGWVRSETSLVFTISISSFCIGGILAGVLTKNTSHRTTLYTSAFLILAGFLGATRISTLLGIYITYGVMVGSGVGLGYFTIVEMIAMWYRDKPGFCYGALMMGFGFGGLLLGTSAAYLMDIIGWQGTFILFGAISAVLVFLSSIIVKENPPEMESSSGKQIVLPIKELDHKQMVKEKSFWLFYFWGMFMVTAGLSVIGNAVPIAQEIGMPVRLATAMSGLISIANGGSRILFGSAFDRFGKDKTILIDSLIALAGTTSVIIALSTNSIPLLIVGFILTGLSYGGTPPITASFTNRMYGLKNYTVNFGIINTMVIAGTFLGPAMTGAMQVSSGSYLSAFYVLLAMGILSSISGYLVRKA
jgi:OFA family oxalate/formate antiporter-like MFS transporter